MVSGPRCIFTYSDVNHPVSAGSSGFDELDFQVRAGVAEEAVEDQEFPDPLRAICPEIGSEDDDRSAEVVEMVRGGEVSRPGGSERGEHHTGERRRPEREHLLDE